MIGIVIVAHGGLAREYLSAVEHVVGQQPGVLAITIAPGHHIYAADPAPAGPPRRALYVCATRQNAWPRLM